ncbi:hypothetical protein NB311A_13616 [Nitrobacter sp. Nb-311A]|nr:hypothetical protein NB311A_13616 [Nitrobacter sp. Nb-311A]
MRTILRSSTKMLAAGALADGSIV